jgi:hypothetical protein
MFATSGLIRRFGMCQPGGNDLKLGLSDVVLAFFHHLFQRLALFFPDLFIPSAPRSRPLAIKAGGGSAGFCCQVPANPAKRC